MVDKNHSTPAVSRHLRTPEAGAWLNTVTPEAYDLVSHPHPFRNSSGRLYHFVSLDTFEKIVDATRKGKVASGECSEDKARQWRLPVEALREIVYPSGFFNQKCDCPTCECAG